MRDTVAYQDLQHGAGGLLADGALRAHRQVAVQPLVRRDAVLRVSSSTWKTSSSQSETPFQRGIFLLRTAGDSVSTIDLLIRAQRITVAPLLTSGLTYCSCCGTVCWTVHLHASVTHDTQRLCTFSLHTEEDSLIRKLSLPILRNRGGGFPNFLSARLR